MFHFSWIIIENCWLFGWIFWKICRGRLRDRFILWSDYGWDYHQVSPVSNTINFSIYVFRFWSGELNRYFQGDINKSRLLLLLWASSKAFILLCMFIILKLISPIQLNYLFFLKNVLVIQCFTSLWCHCFIKITLNVDKIFNSCFTDFSISLCDNLSLWSLLLLVMS